MHKRVAVLIDGGFFRKRFGAVFKGVDAHNPEIVARTMYSMAMAHAKGDEVYKIFYYDCPPILKKAHNPLTGKAVDFSKTPLAQFMIKYLEVLKKQRKLMLRLGYLDESNGEHYMFL